MTEQDQFSSEQLSIAQQYLTDAVIEGKVTDVPFSIVAKMLGRIAGDLNQRRDLGLSRRYTPNQVEVALAVTDSYLKEIGADQIDKDTEPDIFLGADKLRDALSIYKGVASDKVNLPTVRSDRSDSPRIRIEDLKPIVQAELKDINNFESTFIEPPVYRPEDQALQNLKVFRSWMENSHLQEYLRRKDKKIPLLKATGLSLNTTRAFFGGITGAGWMFSTYLVWELIDYGGSRSLFQDITVDPEHIISLGVGLVAGVVGGRLNEDMAEPRMYLSGLGLTIPSTYNAPDVPIGEEQIMEYQDRGDKDKIVTDLARLDKTKVMRDIRKFVDKN